MKKTSLKMHEQIIYGCNDLTSFVILILAFWIMKVRYVKLKLNNWFEEISNLKGV